jgi:DNA (cytosine-5)-methyltransferase 1
MGRGNIAVVINGDIMKKFRVFEAFAGYGSTAMAMKRLQIKFPDIIEFEFVGISEIDKYAIQAYNALHPGVTNYGDISKIDWTHVPDFDLFTYSFPCTDISNAGRQEGLAKGSNTRSSLLWECQKAIEIKRPKYCLMENVAALVSEKFRPYYLEWERLMCRYGYTNYSRVLNAKDYGIPQNRERIFMVSILEDAHPFYWPEPIPLQKRLKDVLEQKVDEKYYLSNKLINYVFSNGGVNKDIQGGVNVSNGEGNAGAITANYYKSPRQGNYIKENGIYKNKEAENI